MPLPFVSRGLHDEGHQGEIDPGMMRLRDETGALRGYVWVNKDPDTNAQVSFTKFVLLFEGYRIPGNPNLPIPRDPDSTLRFTWDATSLKKQEAINEYHAINPGAHWRYIKVRADVTEQSWTGPLF